MKNRSIVWLAAAAIIVVAFGTMYGIVQQAQRTEANWPQIQLAEDAAAQLNQGVAPGSVAVGKVDLSGSLAPFVIIYNRSGQPVGGSGYLDNHLASAPLGILQHAVGKPYHTVSWQPAAGVRIAVVTVAANNYYILAGRSLTEVEKNETRTLQIASLGCAIALLILAGAYVLSGAGSPARKKGDV